MRVKRIKKLTRYRKRIPVYNIKVRGNNNYFANNILVHNCDDPHNIREVESLTKRIEVLRWWDEIMSSRTGKSPQTTAWLIIMQRSAENDLSGHTIAKETGYEHLCLPWEYEGANRIHTSLGYTDPRTVRGELLWPERYDKKATVQVKKDLNSAYAVAGQMQQSPAPRTGGAFNINDFVIVDNFDRSEIVKSIRYWDKAGTKDAGAKTAGVLMHKCRHEILDDDENLIEYDESFLIEDCVVGQWEAPEREKTITRTATLDGKKVVIWIEQEPGSGGKESAQATQRRNPGFAVRVDKVSGSKETRAEPYETQVESHNVRILKGSWVKGFLDEHEMWPNGKFKDRVDASSGALGKLVSAGKVYVA